MSDGELRPPPMECSRRHHPGQRRGRVGSGWSASSSSSNLRHSKFVGLREDKNAKQVRHE